MNIRYLLALWAAKISVIALKITKHNGTNFPGSVALKICPRFLEYTNVPKTVIGVTGTNGKTTSTNLICDVLNNANVKVLSNRYGSNLNTGISTSLIKGLTFFGKQKYDIAVFEMDERSALKLYPFLKPKYLIVSNLARDSIGRNAHPEYIFNWINNALDLVKDTTLILNSNDALSSKLGRENKHIYFGMNDINAKPFENSYPDLLYCPNCGGNVKYNFRFYRSIGNFYCEECGYKTPVAKYFAEKVDFNKELMTVKEGDNLYDYPLLSNTVFNAFNELALISLLRELEFSSDDIFNMLENTTITESRKENTVLYNGVSYCVYAAKGQLASSSSTIFEFMARENSIKDIVLCMDEEVSGTHPDETLTWMYEADYEFLNCDNIHKIIVSGHMCLNTKLRLLLAGIPEEKIVTCFNEHDAKFFVSKEGISKVYVLNEVDSINRGFMVRDEIVEYFKELNKK